jgi:protein-L-isoaspartate(D-aspartate) O-methyltransferase
MALIDNLIEENWLKTPKIIEAFKKIKRVDFLPEDSKDLAELNEALPIGFGQTISQPLVVAFMLEQLAPREGDKILDIGSGSGWTTALLAEIVGERGKIIAIDIMPELVEFGIKNIEKYNFIKKGTVECICADGSKGYPDYTSRPELAEGFDKILVSATAQELTSAWKKQLKTGGRVVTPIGSSIWLFIKKAEKEVAEASPHLPPHPARQGAVFEGIEYPGFVFVPLITK